MAQDPSIGGACILDSTSSANHGTPNGFTSDNLVDGLCGKALDVTGNDDIEFFDSNFNELTVELCTYNRTLDSLDGGLAAGYVFGSSDEYDFYLDFHSGNAYFGVSDGSSTSSAKAPIDIDWNIFTGVNGNSAEIYKNGNLIETNNRKTLSTGHTIRFGDRPTGAYPFDGLISSLRLSNVARSADWIKTTNYILRDDFITLREPTTFTLTDVYPKDNIKIYGLTQQLQAKVTFSGVYDSYTYDASFYLGDGTYLSTSSGIPSGQLISTDLNTFAGKHYTWYLTATTSGVTRTSRVFEFDVRYLCSGICTVGSPASGIRVHLHKRADGELVGQTTTAGTGRFQIETPYNEEHYVIALHPEPLYNALIYDKIKP
jgi:hypothetical protein